MAKASLAMSPCNPDSNSLCGNEAASEASFAAACTCSRNALLALCTPCCNRSSTLRRRPSATAEVFLAMAVAFLEDCNSSPCFASVAAASASILACSAAADSRTASWAPSRWPSSARCASSWTLSWACTSWIHEWCLAMSSSLAALRASAATSACCRLLRPSSAMPVSSSCSAPRRAFRDSSCLEPTVLTKADTSFCNLTLMD
mmetsp:Transcript_96255/g.244585  ORF Transcript_96255/g.244585 Transcript_96255/m.244585 type:complete len:203 (+) Transcript_96255:281-889(+)